MKLRNKEAEEIGYPHSGSNSQIQAARNPGYNYKYYGAHESPKDVRPEYRHNVVIGKNDYYMQPVKGVYVAIEKKPQLLRRLFLRVFLGFKIVSHNTIFGGEE